MAKIKTHAATAAAKEKLKNGYKPFNKKTAICCSGKKECAANSKGSNSSK
ncbi:MAG: hypothetical protein FWD40_10020 [Treponema sp.]|nr:hypothetical protein [Treponema sp.]